MPYEPETPDDLIPTAEAVKLVPSSRPGKRLALTTMHRWIERGRLRGWRIGRYIFVSRAEFKNVAKPILPINARYSNEPTLKEQRKREAKNRAGFFLVRAPGMGHKSFALFLSKEVRWDHLQTALPIARCY